MAEASDPGPPKVSIGAPPGGPPEHNSGTPSPGGSPEGPPQGAPEGGPQGGPLEGPQEGDNRSDHEVYMEALKGLEGAPKMKLGLEDVKKVAAALGNPQDKYKVIHVAGTNGKGSVCLKVASCLMAKGN
ncbi:folylpolyglutamate synthase, putative [Eimeria maxima]|uniref:Folylpolyglutamate synthase, putative n=1 Tax=Eimeria maxima TaxID=5804 RepID=U6M7D2_EIMMA|nr:folylpolyglutamate synthase, putative [Eimeria maxima]CDJ57550.1 folylpolyglutamate synthase, putative [Eimeria maxima]